MNVFSIGTPKTSALYKTIYLANQKYMLEFAAPQQKNYIIIVEVAKAMFLLFKFVK
jgi:hypothetical protein